MENSNFWANIIFGIVILHVIIGFGYLMYKLSPRQDDEPKE